MSDDKDYGSAERESVLEALMAMEQSPAPRLAVLPYLTQRFRVLFVVRDIEGAEVILLFFAVVFAIAITWPNHIQFAKPLQLALADDWPLWVWFTVLWSMCAIKTAAVVSGNWTLRRWSWILSVSKWFAVDWALYNTLGITVATMFIAVAIIGCFWTIARLVLTKPYYHVE